MTPFDFGAVGDGTTDDATAIDDMLNSGIAEIYLPPAAFASTAQHTIPSTVSKICGPGTFKYIGSTVGNKIFLTYPFTLPHAQTPHIYRARAWLRSKGVVRMHERVQLNTYFALAVADHSLTNLAGNFSRDYFIETVEHETEVTPNPGVFPRLSLGPGQRFASKGSYVIKLSAKGIEAASGWIIP